MVDNDISDFNADNDSNHIADVSDKEKPSPEWDTDDMIDKYTEIKPEYQSEEKRRAVQLILFGYWING